MKYNNKFVKYTVLGFLPLLPLLSLLHGCCFFFSLFYLHFTMFSARIILYFSTFNKDVWEKERKNAGRGLEKTSRFCSQGEMTCEGRCPVVFERSPHNHSQKGKRFKAQSRFMGKEAQIPALLATPHSTVCALSSGCFLQGFSNGSKLGHEKKLLGQWSDRKQKQEEGGKGSALPILAL